MAHAKQVLMCRPSHFQVDYIINPHMQPHTIDPSKAMQQWQALVDTLTKLGLKVEIIEQKPGVPDMVFATDQGIVRQGEVLLANFRYPQREKERIYYRDWFLKHNFKLKELTNISPFEGGDTLFFNKMLFVGTSFRASVASCEELAQKLKVDVIPLRLVDPFYYHLDMCFLPINQDTAFYYPPAFSGNSQRLLKHLVPNLLELSTADAKVFAANSFVNDANIIIPIGTTAAFRKTLQKIGLKIHQLDLSEFKKAGGGIHCLINVLS